MATYLQGVTDYIPQFQPFQPDLNFYANIMQTKQTQYDSNWQSLNKMYGEYYHADLTRDDNIKNRDEYMKNVQFNLERVSQLDLSLEQNVTQATQIFKPIYENKNLMKDMAWTKNFNAETGRAEALRGSSDVEDNKKYWETGVAEMQYLREDFKKASADDAMGFQNVKYTPYVNVQEKALKIAKDFGDVESVNFSKDGRWIVKTKNGLQLEEPLQKLFEAQLGNEPAVQALYKTQAYVDRKSYAKSNAAQFGGDEDAAEMKYLENSFGVLKAQNDLRYKQLQENSKTYDSRIADLQKQVDDGTASPETKLQIEQLKMNKDINDKVLVRAQTENEMLNSGESKTATTSTGFINPYGDLKSLRNKVDSGMASTLMQKDLGEAAHIYAFRNSKTDLKENVFKVNEEKFQQNMAITGARIQGAKEVAVLRQQLKDKGDADKAKVAAGTHFYDEKNQVVPYENQSELYVIKGAKGNSTDKVRMIDVSRQQLRMKTNDHALPWANTTASVLGELYSNNKISKQQLNQILRTEKNPNMSLTEFKKGIDKDPVGFLTKTIGTKGLENIKNKYNSWIQSNSSLSELKGEKSREIIKSNVEFQDYINYANVNQEWTAKSSKAVEAVMKQQGYRGADFLYDQKGNLRSEKEYNSMIKKATGSEPSQDYNDLLGAAAKAWTDEKIMKKHIPGLGQFYNPGTGMFSEGATGIMVNPRSSVGRTYYSENMRDIRGLDFGDTSNVRASFKGYSKTNWDQAGGSKNGKAQTLAAELNRAMNSPKSKVGVFEMAVAPIATGTNKRSAIIIKPSAEWLKQYVSTNKEGTNNLLNQAEYKNILENGINIMTNSDKMTNTMYKSAFKDPLSSYVDTKGSYTYTDPTNPRYRMDITRNQFGTGDYTTKVTYPIWDASKNAYVDRSITDNVTQFGNNLTNTRNEMIYDFFDQVKLQNQYITNGY